MSQTSTSDKNYKIIKYKSLNNLNTKIHTNTLQSSGTRPKFQSIRAKVIESTDQNKPYNKQIQKDRLTRIKSLDQLTKMRESTIYQNMVEIYLKQNQNLKQQNRYLIKQVKKRQKNQQSLNNYITQLHKQIKNLQRNKSRQKMISSKMSNFKVGRTNVQCTQNGLQPPRLSIQDKGIIDEGDTWNTMYQIQQLNDRFNMLMQQYSKEKCSITRRSIRQKLAETAQRMKNFKKDLM